MKPRGSKTAGTAVDKMWLFYPLMEKAAKSYFYPQRFHNKSASIANDLDQESDIARDIGIVLSQLLHFIAGMHHCRMVAAAEGFADLRETVIGQFAR